MRGQGGREEGRGGGREAEEKGGRGGRSDAYVNNKQENRLTFS